MRGYLQYLFRIYSQYWVGFMWSAFWQGSLAIVAVWAINKAFPRIPARIRCWLYRLGLAKSFLQLFAAPQIDLALLPRARTVLAEIVSYHFAEGIPTRGDLAIGFGRQLMALWLIGLSVGLVGVVMAYARARSMATRSVSLCRGELDAFMARLCRQMGISCRPRLVSAGWASVPTTLRRDGRYIVVVPVEMLAPERQEDLQLALAHELAHIKRKDLAWNWLPTAAKVLFFFNPLVWVADRELGIAQEMACDEMAVRATGAGSARYGRVLLTMVRPNREAGFAWAVASASAGAPVEVMRRRLIELKHVQDPPVRRVLASTVALLLTCFLVVPLQLVEAPRDGLPRPGISRIRDRIYISEPWGEQSSLEGLTIGVSEPWGDIRFSEGTSIAILMRESASNRYLDVGIQRAQ